MKQNYDSIKKDHINKRAEKYNKVEEDTDIKNLALKYITIGILLIMISSMYVMLEFGIRV